MKIYISGKITGDPDYRKKFNVAAKFIEKLGHIPLNPAVLPSGMFKQDYMRICLAMLESADTICMIGEWESSRCAQIEKEVAEYNNMEVFKCLEDIPDISNEIDWRSLFLPLR